MSTTTDTVWSARADIGQASLDHFFGAAGIQLLNNTYPFTPEANGTFNYWWLAHVIEARLDAYERTGRQHWLEEAVRTYGNIRDRNNGSLFNDYFDDMLWYGLAILRLHDATGTGSFLDDAVAIWEHVHEFGWNEHGGHSIAWRKQQLHYKNTPANGPFVILSCRLAQHTADPRYLPLAITTFDWLTHNLVDERNGFVEDGINREADGRVDTHWRFTYNQGLYIGAAVELSRCTGDPRYLDLAARTAVTAIDELSEDGVFRGEGDGGDEGLFKGVYYRYAGLLLQHLTPASEAATAIRDFIQTSTDMLARTSIHDGLLLAANDWSTNPEGTIAYSTELSAIMALEVRARLETPGFGSADDRADRG